MVIRPILDLRLEDVQRSRKTQKKMDEDLDIYFKLSTNNTKGKTINEINEIQSSSYDNKRKESMASRNSMCSHGSLKTSIVSKAFHSIEQSDTLRTHQQNSTEDQMINGNQGELEDTAEELQVVEAQKKESLFMRVAQLSPEDRNPIASPSNSPNELDVSGACAHNLSSVMQPLDSALNSIL